MNCSRGVIRWPAICSIGVRKTFPGTKLACLTEYRGMLQNPASAKRSGKSGRDLTRRVVYRSEEHTSELQSHLNLVCRLLLEKKHRRDRKVPYREAARRHPR